jgi:D-beta-D-heptose 7-phosphate kinase/D-beta-D-heptose 1-phosphate adenosyltransferase
MIDPSVLASHIESLGDSQVLCVGDLMLDRFIYGAVERTSPEAPVPVLRIGRDDAMLGGVGNVVRNLVSLGARACLLSAVGDDEVGRTLTTMVGHEARVEPHLLVERGRASTEKTRFVAEGQQLLRADSETTEAITPRTAETLRRMAEDVIPDCNVVVFSDYAKGVLTGELSNTLLALARGAGKAVVVDPKGRDYERYRGASVITPNRGELAAALGETVEGDDAVVAAARRLIIKFELGAALITRSQEGMTLVSSDGRVEHLPAQAREVYDVSGAGDTVIATLAAALGQGVDLIEAAALANTAAGVVVSKAGTAVVHAADLLRAVRASDLSSSEAKIVPLPAALELAIAWRTDGFRIGFANGCFDLLHPGHISLLRQARAACDRLVIGLNSDASVRRLKGHDRPVQSEGARAQVLASLETVDLVVIFGEDTPMRLIEGLKPDVLVKGSDYTVDRVVGGEFVQSHGGSVLIAENEPGFSTTQTIQRLRG